MDRPREGGRTGIEANATEEKGLEWELSPQEILGGRQKHEGKGRTAGSEQDRQRHIASSLGNKRIEISPSP